MTGDSRLRGLGLLLGAAMLWGGLFPVAKAVLAHLDPFYMTAIRYGSGAVVFLVLLLCSEGTRVLKTEGRTLELYIFGSFGFAGFSLLAFTGLERSRPEHAAVIMALMPLITVVANWLFRRVRPANFTLGTIVVALAGVVLVTGGGHPETAFAGGQVGGDLLLLGGATSWVIYTLGAGRFPDWSPLRYTALSCAFGVLTILATTAAMTWAGRIQVPAPSSVGPMFWEMVYVIFTSVVAVFCWNTGIRLIGPVNGVLFINFVPVTAFTIGLLRGRRFGHFEIMGALFVMGALIVNNWYLRQTAARRAESGRNPAAIRRCTETAGEP